MVSSLILVRRDESPNQFLIVLIGSRGEGVRGALGNGRLAECVLYLGCHQVEKVRRVKGSPVTSIRLTGTG